MTMVKCKHNRLPDRVRTGRLARTDGPADQYYCTQCQAWVPAQPINAEADRRDREDRDRMARLRGGRE